MPPKGIVFSARPPIQKSMSSTPVWSRRPVGIGAGAVQEVEAIRHPRSKTSLLVPGCRPLIDGAAAEHEGDGRRALVGQRVVVRGDGSRACRRRR